MVDEFRKGRRAAKKGNLAGKRSLVKRVALYINSQQNFGIILLFWCSFVEEEGGD